MTHWRSGKNGHGFPSPEPFQRKGAEDERWARRCGEQNERARGGLNSDRQWTYLHSHPWNLISFSLRFRCPVNLLCFPDGCKYETHIISYQNRIVRFQTHLGGVWKCQGEGEHICSRLLMEMVLARVVAISTCARLSSDYLLESEYCTQFSPR